MRLDTLGGDRRNFSRKLGENVGKATRVTQLEGDGIADRPGGQLQKTIGAAREAIGGGKLEENVGRATLDTPLQGHGIADHPGDQLQKTVGAAGKEIGGGVGPLTQRAKRFARERPFVTAALLGTLSLVLINMLCGKIIRG